MAKKTFSASAKQIPCLHRVWEFRFYTIGISIFCFVSRYKLLAGRHRSSRLYCKAQIPLGSSRLDSTRSTCRAHAFWLCRASRTAQLDSLDKVERVESCRVESRRAKWNLGLSACVGPTTQVSVEDIFLCTLSGTEYRAHWRYALYKFTVYRNYLLTYLLTM